jgi:transposase
MCPAVSKAQQKFFNVVHAVQKGDIKSSDVSKNVKDVANNMKEKDVKDYAETPTKGLPKKMKKEAIEKIIENIVRCIINEENEWYLTNVNKYALLCKSQEEGETVTNLLDKLIDKFGIVYKKIYDKYPNAGLGDTAVADVVHEKLFDKIHVEALIENKLNENRSTDIEYLVKEAKNGGGKVIAELHKQKSGYVNRIVSQYEEIVTELNKLKILKESIDPQIKQYISEIFNDEDKLYTRVIETNRMLITLSKESERKDFKMDTFLEQLDKSELTKDMIESVKKMIDTSYKITKVAPSLKGELKKKNEANVVSKLIDWVKGFIHGVNNFINHKSTEMEKKIQMLNKFAKQLEHAQQLKRIESIKK